MPNGQGGIESPRSIGDYWQNSSDTSENDLSGEEAYLEGMVMNQKSFAAGSEMALADQRLSEEALGKALQAARKAAGLTQQELCHAAGLSYSTLAKIERGAIKSPSIFTILTIAAALKTDLNTLVGQFSPTLSGKPKLRSRSGVRFVFFDINGCLVRFFHRGFTQLAADTGAPADIIETTFWRHNDAVCRGDMSLADFNTTMAQQLGVGSIDWQQYYLEAVEPITEMHDLVTWAADHYEVGLISNIMPGFVQAMIDRKLLPAIPFHTIIDSSAVGVIKPDPKVFEIAQAKAGVDPSEILLVDDERSNLMAAEKLGWHVLWFDDYRPEESAARVRDSLIPEAPQP